MIKGRVLNHDDYGSIWAILDLGSGILLYRQNDTLMTEFIGENSVLDWDTTVNLDVVKSDRIHVQALAQSTDESWCNAR